MVGEIKLPPAPSMWPMWQPPSWTASSRICAGAWMGLWRSSNGVDW